MEKQFSWIGIYDGIEHEEKVIRGLFVAFLLRKGRKWEKESKESESIWETAGREKTNWYIT